MLSPSPSPFISQGTRVFSCPKCVALVFLHIPRNSEEPKWQNHFYQSPNPSPHRIMKTCYNTFCWSYEKCTDLNRIAAKDIFLGYLLLLLLNLICLIRIRFAYRFQERTIYVKTSSLANLLRKVGISSNK